MSTSDCIYIWEHGLGKPIGQASSTFSRNSRKIQARVDEKRKEKQ